MTLYRLNTGARISRVQLFKDPTPGIVRAYRRQDVGAAALPMESLRWIATKRGHYARLNHAQLVRRNRNATTVLERKGFVE